MRTHTYAQRSRALMSRRSLVKAGLGMMGLASTSWLLSACTSTGASQDEGAKQEGSAGSSRLRVVASFYVMADFARKVGGDLVDVTCLVPDGTEPHDWEPSTQDLRTLSEADVIVYNGAGMEHWVEDTLASLTLEKTVLVNASQNVELIHLEEGHEHSHAHEEEGHDHEHTDVDPHVWLDPARASVQLAAIAEGFKKADSAHASSYDENLKAAQEQFSALDTQFRTRLEACPHKTIVVSHEAFGYMCSAYGLTQEPIEGIEADAEPDAQQMAAIVERVKAEQITTIFSEELVSPKIAQAIADATGARVEVLNPLEGLSDEERAAGKDYVAVMTDNLNKLVAALS